MTNHNFVNARAIKFTLNGFDYYYSTSTVHYVFITLLSCALIQIGVTAPEPALVPVFDEDVQVDEGLGHVAHVAVETRAADDHRVLVVVAARRRRRGLQLQQLLGKPLLPKGNSNTGSALIDQALSSVLFFPLSPLLDTAREHARQVPGLGQVHRGD